MTLKIGIGNSQQQVLEKKYLYSYSILTNWYWCITISFYWVSEKKL